MTGKDATMTWAAICRYDDLLPERGVAALVGDVQVALFRCHDGQLFALGNRDPFTGTCVLARGIVGSRAGRRTVASPLHKQVFDLRTGECLDAEGVTVPVYEVRSREGMVEVKAT
ncbi:nitrite reductase small subunit [Frankia sp. CcI49]|nr:nitrite reductase small subunit [Frankia sp. CcI49]